MSAFLHVFSMGGYALYIWPAYGIVCFVLVFHMMHMYRQSKLIFRQLRQWFLHERRT